MKRIILLLAFASALLLNGCTTPPYSNPDILFPESDMPPASGSVM